VSLQAEVEQFLYREARLLDTGQFEAWLGLFTPDAIYWAPAGSEHIDPARHVSIIHDDMAALGKRVKRLLSGHAYAQEPASRIHRLVSNVELAGNGHGEPEGIRVHSMMLMVELLHHRQTLHSARCDYELVRASPGPGRADPLPPAQAGHAVAAFAAAPFLIRRKKVNLLRMGEVLEGIGYLL